MNLASEVTASPTTSKQPSGAAARFVEAFSEGWRAPENVDRFCDYFEQWLHPDIRLVQPQLPPLTGYRAFREQFARPLFELVPDIHGTVEGWAASGSTVYIEILLEGTTGTRRVTARSCDRITLGDDGRAIERVAYLDPTPLMAAIALTPRAWAGAVRQQLSSRRHAR